MRVIIVEGTLDEILTVMQRIEGIVSTRDEPLESDLDSDIGKENGNGVVDSDSTKKAAISIPLTTEQLSAIQRSVLLELMAGSSNKIIGRKFSLTESGVKYHVKNVMRKLGVLNRSQAAVWGQINLREQNKVASMATTTPSPSAPTQIYGDAALAVAK